VGGSDIGSPPPPLTVKGGGVNTLSGWAGSTPSKEGYRPTEVGVSPDG